MKGGLKKEKKIRSRTKRTKMMRQEEEGRGQERRRRRKRRAEGLRAKRTAVQNTGVRRVILLSRDPGFISAFVGVH